MTRQEGGIILWSGAGAYALYLAGSLVAIYGATALSGGPSVIGEPHLRLFQVLFDVAVGALLLAGVLLLRHRAALARWLFRSALPRSAPAGPADRNGGELGGPDRPEGIRDQHQPMSALDLCALIVAALAIHLLFVCLSEISYWSYRTLWALQHPSHLARPGVVGGLAPILLLAGSAALLARRGRVAAWVLRRNGSAPGAAERTSLQPDLQRVGLRLFGLMLVLSELPALLSRATIAYERLRQEAASHGVPARFWQPLIEPVLTLLLGLGLVLGRDGLRLAWRRFRSLPEEDADTLAEPRQLE
jgi:hypothetical protein